MKLTGGCNCGQVRYELVGEPIRVGICHCETCRKQSGSAFSYFGIWPRDSATLSGNLACWQSRAGGERFCPTCGTPLFCWADGSDELEIKLGTLETTHRAASRRPMNSGPSAASHGWRTRKVPRNTPTIAMIPAPDTGALAKRGAMGSDPQRKQALAAMKPDARAKVLADVDPETRRAVIETHHLISGIGAAQHARLVEAALRDRYGPEIDDLAAQEQAAELVERAADAAREAIGDHLLGAAGLPAADARDILKGAA